MSDIAIIAENLSKSYLVGHQSAQRESYTALRDVIGRESSQLCAQERRSSSGQADRAGRRGRGILGPEGCELRGQARRGARHHRTERGGQIDPVENPEPDHRADRGRVILRGRVASLLEVGTGFHPELTGRENIFLNGAILGMTRAEIKSKFDEIVAFAEVERFLDTPVKRYSSGMYVRLAFAVAAHLEPEILIVDEVLAVGDAEFQKKCLGKMHAVAVKENRTVLFVSHNLQAIQSLCDRAILLDKRSCRRRGGAKGVVGRHLASASPRLVKGCGPRRRPQEMRRSR